MPSRIHELPHRKRRRQPRRQRRLAEEDKQLSGCRGRPESRSQRTGHTKRHYHTVARSGLGRFASSPEGETAYIDADLREPAKILAQAARTLDFTRPTALLLVSGIYLSCHISAGFAIFIFSLNIHSAPTQIWPVPIIGSAPLPSGV